MWNGCIPWQEFMLWFESPRDLEMKIKLRNLLEGKDSIVIPMVVCPKSSGFGWSALILPHISSYFQPLIPLLEELWQELLLPIRLENGIVQPSSGFTHHMFIKVMVKMLARLPDSSWIPYPKDLSASTVTCHSSTSSTTLLPPIVTTALLSSDSLSCHSPLWMTGTSSGSAGIKCPLDGENDVSNPRGKKHTQPNTQPANCTRLEEASPFLPPQWPSSAESSMKMRTRMAMTILGIIMVACPARDLTECWTNQLKSPPLNQAAHDALHTLGKSHAPPRSPQPVFSLAAASQEFGFRLPDVASQAHMSAGTAAQTQAPPHAQFHGVVSESSSKSATSETSIPQMFQFEDFNEQNADPPLAACPTRLQHTASFYDIPLTVNKNGHSITMVPRVRNDRDEPQVQSYSHYLTKGNKGQSRASCELPAGHIDDAMTLNHTATQPPQECYYQAPTQLCQGNLAIAAQEPEDIVAAHHKCNCAPQLPSSMQLLATKQRQTSSTTSVGLGDQETLPTTQVLAKSQEILSATETATHGHGVLDTDVTKPVGPATEGAELWQLQYYDPSTHDIIDCMKQFSHCWWPHHASGITRLLWEDLGNWCSGLRKKARSFVAQCYQWDPENHCEQNIEIARHLLGNGSLFLKNGVDDEGHANNLAHLALAGLIVDFFYSGSTLVGQLFPEVFSLEVPRVAVAIAATALKVILDKIVSGVGEVNFRVTTYSPIYVEILRLMSKCDTSPIHQAKTQTLCIRWAQLGRLVQSANAIGQTKGPCLVQGSWVPCCQDSWCTMSEELDVTLEAGHNTSEPGTSGDAQGMSGIIMHVAFNCMGNPEHWASLMMHQMLPCGLRSPGQGMVYLYMHQLSVASGQIAQSCLMCCNAVKRKDSNWLGIGSKG
ncbi:hypothetical protein EDD17DRAFT_1508795 [Pisolithus thermaeus]|nr:hypothetical protein EDD17DRAFT_1508795 [Pisolithus thermaeus]